MVARPLPGSRALRPAKHAVDWPAVVKGTTDLVAGDAAQEIYRPAARL